MRLRAQNAHSLVDVLSREGIDSNCVWGQFCRSSSSTHFALSKFKKKQTLNGGAVPVKNTRLSKIELKFLLLAAAIG